MAVGDQGATERAPSEQDLVARLVETDRRVTPQRLMVWRAIRTTL